VKAAKNVFFACLILFVHSHLFSLQELEKVIRDKNWLAMSYLFSDDSHQLLHDYFSAYDKIELTEQSPNALLYHVKFESYAEIGNILFKKEDALYSEARIENRLTPFHFIDSFRKYRLVDRSFDLGDAVISFHEGYLFKPLPAGQPCFFIGRWTFSVVPSDEEERLTLQRRYKNDSFTRLNNWGIFALTKSFIDSDPPAVEDADDEDIVQLLPMMRYVRDFFGVYIDTFNEMWYLSTEPDANFVFFEDTKRSYYLYDFNMSSSPDTRLTQSQGNKIVLSYDSIKKPKLRLGLPLQMDRLSMNLVYSPLEQRLSGTASLVFDRPASRKTLFLDKELEIKAVLGHEKNNYNLFRRGDRYFLRGPETDRITVHFRGGIKEDNDYSEIPIYESFSSILHKVDDFFFLSRNQNFFPNSGLGFFSSQVTVSVPIGLRVLGSGHLIDQHIEDNQLIARFRSSGSKGFSLVSGDFFKSRQIKSLVPVNIMNNRDFKYHFYLNLGEIKSSFDFLIDLFGELEIPEINLLLRRWHQDGGISLQGLIVLNVDTSQKTNLNLASPVFFSGNRNEYLVHEFAHQWWGGLVSWETYRDVWITEGMSQFAVLSYLEDKWSASRFYSLLRRIRRGVIRDAQAGPPIYGLRIANLEDNLELYQSIVYNKSALVMLMLREILGADDFNRKIRSFLVQNRYRSINSRKFVNHMSAGNPEIEKFFADWIYSRRLPELTSRVKIDGYNVSLRITQKNTDFIFPLEIEIISGRKKLSTRKVIVQGKEAEFSFTEKRPISALRINPVFVPLLHR